MTGEYYSSWPEKTKLSGQEIINPEGALIYVPYLDQHSSYEGEYTSKTK